MSSGGKVKPELLWLRCGEAGLRRPPNLRASHWSCLSTGCLREISPLISQVGSHLRWATLIKMSCSRILRKSTRTLTLEVGTWPFAPYLHQAFKPVKERLNIGLVIVAMGLLGCSPSEKTEIYDPEFKWSITIPEGFDSVGAEDWEKMQERGTEAVESTVGEEIQNQTTTLFVFNDGPTNYFEANFQPFDESVDGSYDEAWKSVNEILYETFRDQIPGAEIDTASFVEMVDGLEFRGFRCKVNYTSIMNMNVLMYSRLFDDREFSVNIMYTSEDKGEKMKAAWLASKFAK